MAGYPLWLWLLLLVVPVPFAFAVYVYQNRTIPGMLLLVWMLTMSGLYILAHAVHGFTVSDASVAVRFDYLHFTLLVITSLVWFQFLLAYLGQIEDRAQTRAGLVGVIVVLCLANFSDPVHGNGYLYADTAVSTPGTVPVVEVTPGLLYIAELFVVFLVGLIGFGLLTNVLVTRDELFSGQALALLFGSASPYLAGGLDLLDAEPVPALPLIPFGFFVMNIGLTYAATSGDLLDVAPAAQRIGKDRALEQLTDGIIITGTDGTVLDVNERACQLLGIEESAALGTSITTIHEDVESPDKIPETLTVDGHVLETSASPVEGQTGDRLGYTLRYSRITQEVRRQQRLEVLHRIMRHNLRNKLTVIDGYTDYLRTLDSPAVDMDHISMVEESLGEIASLTEKSGTIEQTLDSEQQTTRVELPVLVDDLANEIDQQFPDATFETDVPAEATCVTYKEHLWTILWNLVENGIEHNDDAQPKVSLTARCDREHIECVVSDNGPGIPRDEIETIESGTETQLQHGSGLGIWLVKWCVEDIDGDLDIDASMTGTDVRVTVPSLDRT